MAVDDDLTELSEMQLDVLQEIGNVGAGNSATALSRLIHRNWLSSVFSCAFMGRHRATSSFSFRARAPLRL